VALHSIYAMSEAIGIVATIIVFGSAMLVKEGWALLGVLERSQNQRNWESAGRKGATIVM
jgi:hypothetical protein